MRPLLEPLLGLFRRLVGREEEEPVIEAGRAAPGGEQGLPGGELPRGSGAAAPSGGGKMPRGAGLPLPGSGGTPGTARAEAAVFSGAEVRGTAESFAGASGGPAPLGRGASSFSGGTEEVLVLAGPPEDGARALSELLRFQRRMGSTVGDFGEEVL